MALRQDICSAVVIEGGAGGRLVVRRLSARPAALIVRCSTAVAPRLSRPAPAPAPAPARCCWRRRRCGPQRRPRGSRARHGVARRSHAVEQSAALFERYFRLLHNFRM